MSAALVDEQPRPAAPMVDYALKTARAGLPVMLVSANGKEATQKGFPDLATTNVQQIGKWWSSEPYANHGYTLDGLMAIDVDPPVGGRTGDGPATWMDLSIGREVPETRRVSTPSGGEHMVFTLPDGVSVKSQTNGLGPGVDVKSGRTAYLVGPGSRTEQGAYTLACDARPAPAPEWLLTALRDAGLVTEQGQQGNVVRLDDYAAPGDGWSPLAQFGEPIPKGQRHDVLYRSACSMRARRFHYAEAARLLQLRHRDCEQPPGDPYTEAQAEAVLNDVWQRYPSGAAAAEVASTGIAQDGPPRPDPSILYGVLGDIVRAADPYTEADPVGVLVSLLGGVGVLLGAVPHVQVGATRHPLLIWSLLFGRTGSGRKGDAAQAARLFLLSSYPEAKGLMVSGLSSGEGLVERLRDTDDENDQGGTEDKRLIVTEPEFSSVMARSKREGSTLPAVLRQAWEGDALAVLNRSAITASSSHVAISGHVTPGEFRKRLAESDMTGGTYNRFLPVYVERSKRLALPDPVPDAVRATWSNRLHKAINDGRSVGRLTLGPKAAQQWSDDLYPEFSDTDDEDMPWAEFTRRAAPYCLRVAGLYATLRNSSKITTADLAAAAALVRYSMASARFVLDNTARDPRLDRIRRAIDSSPEGLTRTEISGLFSRNLSAPVLDELLSQLTTSGPYVITTVRTGGRPADRYRRTK